MSDSNKTLKIVFVILLLITAGELFYFFIYQPSSVSKLNVNLTPTISQVKVEDLAINRDQINYLSNLKKSSAGTIKTFMKQEEEGFVKQLKSISEKNASIVLIDNNQNIIDEYKIFPNAKMIAPKIYAILNDITSPVTIQDIKVGDKIRIVHTFDVQKNQSEDFVSNEIFILQ